MEAGFVNIFVEKQREVIVDLTSRNIMLDARISFAEQKLEQMQELNKELETNKAHVNQLIDENKFVENKNEQLITTESRMRGEMLDINKELLGLRTKVSEQKTEIEQLLVEIKKLKIEKEVSDVKTARLKNKAKQLAEE